MKVTIEFDLKLDGDITENKAKKVFLGQNGLSKIMPGGISSEDVDGTDDYVVFINGWQVIKEKK